MSYARMQKRQAEERLRRAAESATQSVADSLPDARHPVILVTEEKAAEVRKRYGIQAPVKSEKQRAAEHFARRMVDRNILRVSASKILRKSALADSLDAATE